MKKLGGLMALFLVFFFMYGFFSIAAAFGLL
jgi:hypothetical protein